MNSIVSNAKALYVDNEILYIARGYRIYKKKNEENWKFDGKIIDSKYTLISYFSRIINRLFRIEPSTMLLLSNGSRLLSAKKGIFVAIKGSDKYIKTFDVPRGNKPLNICLHSDGNIYFGEYILNGKFRDEKRTEVHIYKSVDYGQNWEICYTFPHNTIRHIHGIFYDKYTNNMWITTGDRDQESMIASTSDGFKTINILKKGSQKYRAVTLLFYKDYIVYGTDTEHEENYIYLIDRETGVEKCLQNLQGSVLMATQYNNLAVLSTAVEPSKINCHSYAHIWFTENGIDWKDIYKEEKDFWSAKYFQYGRITFPQNALNKRRIIFSGNALKNIDNKTLINKLKY